MKKLKKGLRILGAIYLGLGGIYYVFSGMSIFGGIILLLIAVCIWSINNAKDSEQLNGNSQNREVAPRGEIRFNGRYPATSCATFYNGVVYYGYSDSVMGRYDKEGKVYDRNNHLIGKIVGEGIYMDRTYEYEWLKKTLPDDPNIDKDKLQVPMEKYAGSFYGSYIETCEGEQNIVVLCPSNEDEQSNSIGACATYLACLQDGLLAEKSESFYYTIQKECYFRQKNPSWNAYYDYQKRLWSGMD